MVPGAGVEPALPNGNKILSLVQTSPALALSDF